MLPHSDLCGGPASVLASKARDIPNAAHKRAGERIFAEGCAEGCGEGLRGGGVADEPRRAQAAEVGPEDRVGLCGGADGGEDWGEDKGGDDV